MGAKWTNPSGTNDGVVTAEATTAVDNFSIGYWFWSSNTTTEVKVYNGNPGGTGCGISQHAITAGNINIIIGGIAYVDGAAFTANQWHSAILVRNAGTMQLYLNGSAVGSTSAITPNTPTGTGSFGALQGYTSTTGTCKAAEAFIYDRPLSASEITAIGANRQSPLFYPRGLLRYIPIFLNTVPEPTGRWGLYGGDNLTADWVNGSGEISKDDHPPIIYPPLIKGKFSIGLRPAVFAPGNAR